MNTRFLFGFVLILIVKSLSAPAAPALDEFVRNGDFRGGLSAYASPVDNADRFSLALLQALDGAQQFYTGFNQLALQPDIKRMRLPFLRLAAATNPPSPGATATPDQVASLFNNLKTSLQQANETLAAMDNVPFQVEVNWSNARMDLDGDGLVSSNEMLLVSLGRIFDLPISTQQDDDLIVRFDSADAAWLKGYTHFLLCMLDVLTAYDWMPVWNQCAHLVFLNPQPAPPLASYTATSRQNDPGHFADWIATIHDMRLNLVRPEGPREARDAFREMIACSRTCWQRILQETDDDYEWLPSPSQTGPWDAHITLEQIEGWQKVLDELDNILAGRTLLAHWHIKDGWGINVDKLVNNPPRLDPIMLIQGSALLPYLEEGLVSDRTRWQSLIQPFGPGFAWFALWSN